MLIEAAEIWSRYEKYKEKSTSEKEPESPMSRPIQLFLTISITDEIGFRFRRLFKRSEGREDRHLKKPRPRDV